MIKNKGFALVEVLLILFVLTALSLITISGFVEFNYEHLILANEIANGKVEALVNKEERNIYYQGELIRFNSSGNVNVARTFNFPYHKFVIHLGNGYFCLDEK